MANSSTTEEEQPADADVFLAIAHPIRRRILDRLARDDLTVTQLAAPFAVSRPAISQHLRVLREAGLVAERRQGRERRYSLQPQPLAEVSDWIHQYDHFWRTRLAALSNYLDEQDEQDEQDEHAEQEQ
jgi:DNA-binding transcriptional ArsR family regulator